jgi:putative flippase GtrA
MAKPQQSEVIIELLKFTKYFLVGGAAAIIEWSVFWLCVSVFHIFYLIAVAVAFLVATLMNYLLSVRFVFGHGQNTLRVEAILVYFVSAIGLGLNFLLMWILHGKFKISSMPAKIFSTGIVFLWNYCSRRMFIFRVVVEGQDNSNLQ